MATAVSLWKFCLVLLSLTWTAICENKRSITMSVDPGCSKDCGDGIGWYQATGGNDEIQYLVSSIGLPTVLVLHTDKGSAIKPTIDWHRLLSKNESDIKDSITFNVKDLKYSYAVIFPKLYEYNDTQDYADMSEYPGNKTQWNTYDLSQVMWDAIGEDSDIKAKKMVVKSTQQMNTSFENGTFSFNFHAFAHEDRQDDLPHLQYDENNTLVDFLIDHVKPAFSKSRFALESLIISQDKMTEKMNIETTKSIDDEYTPGVFSIINWVTKKGSSMNRGYMQWKPICYQKNPRSRSSATKMQYSDLVDESHFDMESLKQTIAYAYFGDKLMEMALRGTNLSFGLSQDGTYTKTNFTGWSMLIGVGDPPVDRISTLVISVISAGLGLPVVFIIFGGIFVCYKKQKDKNKNLVDVTSGYPAVN